jgi:hypothetical protein
MPFNMALNKTCLSQDKEIELIGAGVDELKVIAQAQNQV